MRFGLPELPLLRRELTEVANRRRTYIVRVIAACAILFFAVAIYVSISESRQQLTRGLSAYWFLGVGGEVFSRLVPILFATVEILTPAFCCASVTAEKENNTIGTLLITRLSPGSIVLEKLFSRVIPVLTILLLTLPVLAYLHSLGGVDTDLLIGTGWLLFSECLLIASFALLCSCWFATTTAAFVTSYLAIGILLALSFALNVETFLPSVIWYNAQFDANTGLSASQVRWVQMTGIPLTSSAGGFQWQELILKTIPCWFVTGLSLLAARLVIVRRAFATPTTVLMTIFLRLDQFFQWLNNRTTGGIEIFKDTASLPDDRPIEWRERTRKSLGKARYLFRILLLLEGPVLIFCILTAIASATSAFRQLYTLEALIWAIVILICSVKAATLFSSERARETLEPLLVTPLSSEELVTQKFAGMRRLMIVLALPPATVALTQFLMHTGFRDARGLLYSLLPAVPVIVFLTGWLILRRLRRIMTPRTVRLNVLAAVAAAGCVWAAAALLIPSHQTSNVWLYLCFSLYGAWLLLSLVSIVSLLVGMKVHSQNKAVVTSMAILAAWIVLPRALADQSIASTSNMIAATFSPYSIVESSEHYLAGRTMYGLRVSYQDDIGNYWWKITHVVYTILLYVVWKAAIKAAPWLMNRRESPNTALRPLANSQDSPPLLKGSEA